MIILGLLEAKKSGFRAEFSPPYQTSTLLYKDPEGIRIEIPEKHKGDKNEIIKDIIHELIHAGCMANENHYCEMRQGPVILKETTPEEWWEPRWNPCRSCSRERLIEELTHFIFENNKRIVYYILRNYK